MKANERVVQTAHAPIVALLEQGKYKEAESGAKELIRSAPLDGQAWVLLGEALLHQGCGRAARRAFERAWLLDPQARWVKNVFELLDATPLGDERADIEGLLHVPKATVAAAILSRNEEQVIERCLKALEEAVDEIVLIDSSTDGTRELASRFSKVTVVPIEWQDDFALARNAGLAHIRSDWVIWVDADEVLLPEDAGAIRETAGIYSRAVVAPVLHVWHLNKVHGVIQHEFSQARMFPTGRGLRFWGRIHEQIGTPSGVYENDTFRRVARIRLLHDGYEPAVMERKQKLDRNLRLLRLMLEEEPDNPGHWLFWGRESLAAGLEEQAHTALLKAEQLAAATPRFGRQLDIYKLLVQLMMKRGNWKEAEAYCEKALAHSGEYPDAHYWLAQVRMKQADDLYRAAEAAVKQSLGLLPSYRGTVAADEQIGEWKAEAALAELALRAGKLSEARGLYARPKLRSSARKLAERRLAWIETERQRLNKPVRNSE